MKKMKLRFITLLAVLCVLFTACTDNAVTTTDNITDAVTSADITADVTNGETNAPAEDTQEPQETQKPQETEKPEDTTAPTTKPAETEPPVQTNPYDRPITPAKTYKPVFSVPAYTDKAYVAVNGNEPFFTEDEKTTVAFEFYGELDSLKRCTYTFACVGKETMPTGSRGSISHKPTGWVQNQYSFVESQNLYNRCHLIAWQLTGENNNKQNLLTGTRYLNVQGMIPFEEMVGDYVTETGNHVMYRVTPIFTGNNLLADGVLIEAWSVEDEGDGICFNVFSYNVQPGVIIDYATGNNHEDPNGVPGNDPTVSASYVINKGNHKVHKADCGNIKNMNPDNRIDFVGTIAEILAQYPDATSAGCCHPY